MERLAQSAGGLSRTARQAIGYQELLEVVAGRMSLDEARGRIVRRLRSFARRQEAWFRRDPRVTWFAADDVDLGRLVLEHWRASDGATADAAASWETESL